MRRPRPRELAAALVASVVVGLAGPSCARRPTGGPALANTGPIEPPPSASVAARAEPEAAASATVDLAALALEKEPSAARWSEAVRMERWDEAWKLLGQLSDKTKAQPELRLVRARVAMSLGEHGAALPLLDSLENDLVPLADLVARWRAEAQLSAGPYAEAARYYVGQGGARGLARAALAFEKAGLGGDARKAADRAIALGKGGADELSAREVRLRLADAAGQKATAAEDARWIATHAPERDPGAEAERALERLDPGRPLTGRERVVRAEKLSEAGKADEALAELDRAAKAPSPPAADELAYARAMALYRARGRYLEAAALFDKVAAKKGPKQADAAFHAARARSRADHDDEAARGYRSVAARFPRTPWADEATYLAARLGFLHGRFRDAAGEYAAYLKRFGAGRFRDAAVYERAISLLGAQRWKEARAELKKLAEAAAGAESARLHELEGIAQLGAGDRAGAVRTWTEVASAQPLTWAAIAARARLAKAQAPAPPVLSPSDGKSGDPLPAKLPAVAGLLHALGLDADAEAWLRAREREAASPGTRQHEELCEIYGKLSRATRQYRVGVDSVAAALLSRAPSPATEWAWRCVYPRPYQPIVTEVEEREALPKGLVYAIMRQESAYDPDVVSGARAVGLLQLMPETAKRIADESGLAFDEKLLKSPPVNLDLGSRYLAKMLRTFKGSIPLAAAAYNAGPRAVGRWLERADGLELDTFVARIPYEETRTYVSKVLSNLARYAYLDGGDGAVPTVELALPKDAEIEASAY